MKKKNQLRAQPTPDALNLEVKAKIARLYCNPNDPADGDAFEIPDKALRDMAKGWGPVTRMAVAQKFKLWAVMLERNVYITENCRAVWQ